MKKFVVLMMIAFVLFLGLGIDTSPVYAYAYDSSFISMIHYQNLGPSPAALTIDFYDGSGAKVASHTVATLETNAATSLYAGSISGLPSGFEGGAVISSSQPVASTVAQIGSGAVKNQALSNGFSSSETSNSVLIPTVLKNMFFFNSVFSVQNVDAGPADIVFTFKTTTGSEYLYTVEDLPAFSSYFVDMGSTAAIPTSTFNGSVVIEAFQANTTDPGAVAATSMEMEISGNNVYAFNGVATSGTSDTIYMPSAVCKFGPNKDSTSAYAVQNTTSGPINVTVTYSNGHIDGPYEVPAYSKRSFDGCSAGNPVGFLGSAIVTSVGGDIHAVGKVYGGGLYPAHLGFTGGSDKVALPFVRWTETHWYDGTGLRSYIAVQNIGTSSIADGDVVAYYYDKNGVLVGSHALGAIAVGAKQNTHPFYLGSAGSEFGTYTDGSSGGGVIIVGPSGSELAVVARVQKYIGYGNSVGEDYEGMPAE